MEGEIYGLDWGWKLEDNQLVPILSYLNIAVDTVLKMVHCNCTTGYIIFRKLNMNYKKIKITLFRSYCSYYLLRYTVQLW